MTCIEFFGLTLDVLSAGRKFNVLNNADFEFPIEHLALLSPSRLDVVAVLDLLTRRIKAKHGEIRFGGSISWVIGNMAPFSVAVTGTQAISHFCSIYGVRRDLALDFIGAEFAEPDRLPTAMYKWPKDLQFQFAMLVALIPQFDIYLVDGPIVLPAAPEFTRRFLRLFSERTKGRAILITGRQPRVLLEICTGAVVISNQRLKLYNNVGEALKLTERRGSTLSRDEPDVETQAEPENYDEFLF